MATRRICLNCGQPFEAERSTAKFHNDTCRSEWNRKNGPSEILTEHQVPIAAKGPIKYDPKYHLEKFRKMGLAEVKWLSSGIAEFDELTQIPRGRVTQIYGPYGVGKTTLCLNMLAGMNDDPRIKKVLYIDSEASLNPRLMVDMRLNADKIDLYNESAFIEDIYEVIINAVLKPQYDVIIFDSVAATTFRQEAANEAADRNIGQKAIIMNKLLRIIPNELRKTDTALVLINQERDTIGTYVPMKYTPGGTGITYTASLMVRLSTNKSSRFPDKPPFKGQWVEAEITKSKVNDPWRKKKFKLYYGSSHAEAEAQAAGTPQEHLDTP